MQQNYYYKKHIIMKKHILTYIGLIPLLFIACNRGPSTCNQPKNLEFENLSAFENVKLTDEEYPKGTFCITLDWPVSFKSKKDLKTLQQLVFKAVFGSSFDGNTPIDDILSKQIADQITNYLAEVEELKKDGLADCISCLTRENWQTGRYIWYNNTMLLYEIHTYSYTGGAHGGSTSQKMMVDLNTLEIIDEQAFFDKKNLDNIAALLKKQYAKDNDFSTVDELKTAIGDEWFNAIKPNGSAYLDYHESSQTWFMTWQFAEYEIGPYVIGRPRIKLEISKVKSYLKKDLTPFLSIDNIVVNPLVDKL